jgi:hypothetical protein
VDFYGDCNKKMFRKCLAGVKKASRYRVSGKYLKTQIGSIWQIEPILASDSKSLSEH